MVKYRSSMYCRGCHISMSDELIQEIQVFRANNIRGARMMNFSEAIRVLIRFALENFYD